MELLADAPLGYLLGLMIVPGIAAVLLAIFIAFTVARRRRKSQMKLGSEASSKETLDTSLIAQSSSPAMSGNVSPPPSSEPPGSLPGPDQERTDRAEGRWSHHEFLTGAEPQHIPEEKIDLATRLGNQQPEPPVIETPEPELMRLLRDPESGQLIVEIGGQHYTKLVDIKDKEKGQYILKLTAHLLAFTNGMIATEAGVKSILCPKVDQAPLPITPPSTPAKAASAPTTESAQSPPAFVEPESDSSPSSEAEAALLASLQNRPSPPVEPPPVSGGFFRRSRPAADEPKLMPTLNLAEEINKIVQARLVASPLAATTRIDITSNPGGGIQIKVNDVVYAGVDDIPQSEVKALIQASIKQWERS